MTVPYQPEPGCSAVQAQQARQIHDLRQQLKAAEDELGPLRQRVDVLNRGAEVREALLAEARDLLEPWGGHGDDWPSLVPPIEALIGKLDESLQRAEQWEQARDAEVLATAAVFHEYNRRWQSTIVEARRQAARADAAEAGMEQLIRAGHAEHLGRLQAEAQLAAVTVPCLIPPPALHGLGDGPSPCIVTGPHIKHRDADGAMWWELPRGCTSVCAEGHTYAPPCEMAGVAERAETAP